MPCTSWTVAMDTAGIPPSEAPIVASAAFSETDAVGCNRDACRRNARNAVSFAPARGPKMRCRQMH